MDWKIFADNLKKYRKDSGLTQDDLAKRLNVSRSAISYYEKGTVEPSIYFLINLANEMNCSIDNLFGFNREVSIELPKNLTKEELKPIEKEFKKSELEIDNPKYYLEKLKKTLIKVQRSYIELEMSKKRTDRIADEFEMSKKRTDRMYDELEMSKKRTDRMYDELEMSKKRTDRMYDELEMSKKRTDRMYDELVRTFNREERFKEMLDELTELENKFNYKFELKNKGKTDIEIADDLTQDISYLRNKKLEEFEENYKNKKNNDNITFIKQYGNVAAGLPSFASEEVERLLYLPQKYFCSSANYFALKIHGDSMNKLYENGEIIIVRKTSLVNNGNIIIACISGEATCKEYYFNKDENKHELIPHSTNSNHKPQFYSDDEIMILGIVKCSLNDILDKEIDY
ncbi:helix-turn-helix domain-containing protein [Clostridium perfringens]|uniref:helix-turn-helix domain-containing protein n=1 Tax=Clostridium perfringens TaxID=1502 RepID=UPI0018E47F5E|nr:S24 family peptidase [Clostridium perfringens]MBI6068314.1 helix-turn-helix domain-containing protein [Clostridium perfringens]MBI6096969.1 helix-turn-helix domain-containing protein [Clostridium perfringens]